jgi:hypothetical protein
VTILGRGDLSPRRHSRPAGRYLLILLVVALLAGGGYAGYRGLTGGSSNHAPSAPVAASCPKPLTSAEFAPPHQVKLRVFNASLRTGLAAQVRAELVRRRFHVVEIGNALRVGHNIAMIRYSPDQKRAASTVAAQISGRLTMKPVTGENVLELDIGVHFVRLRSAAAAKAVERRVAASASPSPSPSAARACHHGH